MSLQLGNWFRRAFSGLIGRNAVGRVIAQAMSQKCRRISFQIISTKAEKNCLITGHPPRRLFLRSSAKWTSTVRRRNLSSHRKVKMLLLPGFWHTVAKRKIASVTNRCYVAKMIVTFEGKINDGSITDECTIRTCQKCMWQKCQGVGQLHQI